MTRSRKARDASELMAACDRYFERLARGENASHLYAPMVEASNELARRGPVVVPWARGLLAHADYGARAIGAFVLGALGARGLLRDATSAVVTELGALATRPWVSDVKEIEANESAMCALAEIGDRAALPHLARVLRSTEPWAKPDVKWTAALALAKVAGADLGAGDPVAAALAWLDANGS